MSTPKDLTEDWPQSIAEAYVHGFESQDAEHRMTALSAANLFDAENEQKGLVTNIGALVAKGYAEQMGWHLDWNDHLAGKTDFRDLDVLSFRRTEEVILATRGMFGVSATAFERIDPKQAFYSITPTEHNATTNLITLVRPRDFRRQGIPAFRKDVGDPFSMVIRFATLGGPANLDKAIAGLNGDSPGA